jgi:ferritin-like metal-binding protein YciE
MSNDMRNANQETSKKKAQLPQIKAQQQKSNGQAQASTQQQAKQQQTKQQAAITKPEELYFSMLNEMLNAEKQILEALPKLAELATAQELKSSLSSHVNETEKQRDRLIQVLQMHSRQEEQIECKIMKSMLDDGKRHVEKAQAGDVRDLALASACCTVEYFEISSYRSLITMADRLNFDEQIDLFEDTLDEEMQAAKTLSRFAAGQHAANSQQGEMQTWSQYGTENDKENQSMRSMDRERDSQGRFTSDDDDRGGRDYSRGGRGRDDEGRGWYGDSRGHSEAAREGWRNREGGGGGGRGRDYDDRDYNRGGRGGDRGQGGWFGDPQGHSEAAREGWRSRDDYRGGGGRGRGYDEDDRDYNRGGRGGDGEGRGWYGDPQGHSEAAREGWRHRDDYRGGSSRGRDYDDNDRDYNRGDRGQGGWFGDPQGHSEAAREGWRHRDDYRGSSSRGRDYDDDDRDYNRGSRGRGHGGWFGDPQGHSEASREGWQNRR